MKTKSLLSRKAPLDAADSTSRPGATAGIRAPDGCLVTFPRSEAPKSGERAALRAGKAGRGSMDYRALLEAAPDGMVVVDQAGLIVLVNAQAERLFGYRRDELIGQRGETLISEPFRAKHSDHHSRFLLAAAERPALLGLELFGLRKDGSEFPAEIRLSPLETKQGVLVSSFIRNVSERRHTEEDLHGLAMIVACSDDAIFGKTLEGIITSWNASAERIYGYRAEEAIGKSVGMLIPSNRQDEFAEVLELVKRGGSLHHFETVRVRKDGKEIPIELTVSPIRDGLEKIVGASSIGRDISVRKKAENAISQAEAKYRGLLEAAPDSMVVVNQDGEIVLLNVQAERQFGYGRNELLGQKVTTILPVGFAERLAADALRPSEAALAQEIGAGIELTGLRKNGSEFPVELMLSPLESATGILVTAAIRDITKRKMAEELLLQKVAELNRSNEELGRFAYVASHDLQEPLRMVASYTQLLSKRYKGKLDSDADDFIAFAVDGATRMQHLIQALLAFSRVTTTGSELTSICSGKALQEALINLRGAIEESGALVTHDPLPRVLADQMQLTQLFQNLVSNAIKYHNGGVPRVHISAEKNGGKKWIFSVQDNGLGIDPQYFEKIFGMFQRLHKWEEFAGTGIGLAICKRIVERHGGAIWVESQPGQGSNFRFSLKRSRKAS